MHASVPRAHLVRVLERVRHAGQAESAAMLPLYAHVRVAVEKGALHVACLSMEGAARADVDLAEQHEDGVVAVSWRRLYDLARMSEDESPVRLECAAGTRLTVRTTDGVAHLPTLPEPDQLLDAWTLDIHDAAVSMGVNAELLGHALRHVRHAAAARDDSRPAMRGVCLDVGPASLDVVATDGARFAQATVSALASGSTQCVLTPTAVDTLLATLDGIPGVVQLDVHPTVTVLEHEHVAVRAQGISVPFPPWREVLGQLSEGRPAPMVNAERLAALAKRAVAVAGVEVPTKILIHAEGVRLASESGDGAIEGRVGHVHVDGDGHGVEVPIKARFLVEALEAGDWEQVTVGPLRTGDAPPVGLALRSGAWRAVIMRRDA